MRKFNVTVNGVLYEVEVEELTAGASAAPVASVATPVAAPVAAPAAPAAVHAAPVAPAGATSVNAPMPGNILDIKVSAGQSVKKGDVLCILEAMKMENEISCPQDGVVASIAVQKGATVSAGDLLISLK